MADITRRVEETASIIGFVIKMGPDCYKDEKRFPNGAYCKEGDFVIMRAYSGTRMKIHGKEFRIINDDTVEAVVQDPTGIVKAFVVADEMTNEQDRLNNIRRKATI